MKRLYLCGPMTGLPEFNYPAFHAAAAELRALGYHVENPAENPAQDSWEAYMVLSIAQLHTCQAVATLPGWENSRGATIEVGEAEKHLLEVLPASQWAHMRKLEDA